MKDRNLKRSKLAARAAIVSTAICLACLIPGSFCPAQTPTGNPSELTPDLQEVVKLSQQQMSDDVIISYIKNSGKTYHLSADDLIYLKDQGISQAVLSVLEQTAPASPASPAPSPPAPILSPAGPAPAEANAPASPPPPEPIGTAPPTPESGTSDATQPPPEDEATPEPAPAVEVNFDYFHDQLSPYGTWVQVDPYGWCWRPDAALAANPDWRPYYDMGQWVETDNGLFWQSDYTWGDIPFHYGNWVIVPGYGWLWVPGYTWGPAWVFWRQADADGCIGWAPLPWGAVFVDGGWLYHGIHYGFDFDFGLGENFFVFVGNDHFHEDFFRMRGHEYRYHMGRERVHQFYHRAVVRNDFRRDEHGRLVNNGIGRERMDRLNHNVEHVQFEERDPVGDRNKLNEQRMAQARRADGAGPNHFDRPARVNKVYRPPVHQHKAAPVQHQNKKN